MAKKDMVKDGLKVFGKGALIQINAGNAIGAVTGSLVGFVIRGDSDITTKRVIKQASTVVAIVAAGTGAINLAANMDVIRQREEIRQRGMDPGSIL